VNVPRPPDGARVVVFSGGGLSKASEIPTFRDADGKWEGRQAEDLASVEAWWKDRETVRRFYDVRRLNCVHVMPNPAHEALARLQHRWGARRLVLVTSAIDGLLQKAGAADVIELNGSMWSIECEEDDEHPHLQLAGPQNRDRKCAICGATMRPDVRWRGEPLRHLDRVQAALGECVLYLCVGANELEAPIEQFAQIARGAGARCVEINPVPDSSGYDEVVAEPAEEALPRLVATWLGER
jgi:NAD-dependent deacetylase